jgi:hypothetical protein
MFVLMGGGLGVSGFDVLLFHLHQRDEPPIAHIEAAGAACHAESCLIGYVLNGGRFLSAPVEASFLRPADRLAVAPVERSQLVPSVRFASPLPRSPPLLAL